MYLGFTSNMNEEPVIDGLNQDSDPLADRFIAAFEETHWNVEDPTLTERLGALLAEQQRTETLLHAVDVARSITACAYIIMHQDEPPCLEIVEKLKSAINSCDIPEGSDSLLSRARRNFRLVPSNEKLAEVEARALEELDRGDHRALERLIWASSQRKNKLASAAKDIARVSDLVGGSPSPSDLEALMVAVFQNADWNFGTAVRDRRLGELSQHYSRSEAVQALHQELHSDGIDRRIRESIRIASKHITRDVLVSTVGANLSIPAVAGMAAWLGGPDAAAFYLLLEGLVTVVPFAPGVPNLVRGAYFGVARGVEDGINRFRRLKAAGKQASLRQEVLRSVRMGLPTIIDLGWTIVPVVALLRNMDVDTTASAMTAILQKGLPLYSIMKKYGQLDLVNQVHK